MQPHGRARFKDVNGNFKIVQKEFSIQQHGQPHSEVPGIKFCPESLRAINNINWHQKIQLLDCNRNFHQNYIILVSCQWII